MKTIVLILLTLINHVLGPRPSVQERIAILKSKLLNDGHSEHPSILDYYHETTDDYDNQDFLIEPITKVRASKRYKLRTVTTTTVNVTAKTFSPAKRQGLRPFLKLQAYKKKKEKMYFNPMDVFYRRETGSVIKELNGKWSLCQDVITPYLTGLKKDSVGMTKIGIKDPTPERIFQLLSVNMTSFAKEDVFALMYQINKVQFRLYQWDVMPIRILINLLVKGKSHTYRNLKASLREMFENWHLDFNNLTKIIEDTRILRPVCTVTSQYTGSTKTAKVSRYKEFTKTPPKKQL